MLYFRRSADQLGSCAKAGGGQQIEDWESRANLSKGINDAERFEGQFAGTAGERESGSLERLPSMTAPGGHAKEPALSSPSAAAPARS